uniref:Uncharacterized protein n=1 Tax=Oryza brachyantha TaxID=4533 RepID=J3MX21_ORYBR
ALLARLPAVLARRRGALPRAHPVRGAARHPRAALRAPPQGRRGRGARRVPPRPLGPAVRRRHRRPPRTHGRGLLRAPRAQAAPRLRVRDGHRVGRGRPCGEGARVLPSRWQRRRWSRLRGIVNLYNLKNMLGGQSYLTRTR